MKDNIRNVALFCIAAAIFSVAKAIMLLAETLLAISGVPQ